MIEMTLDMAERAVRVARETEGVKKVVDHLKVVKE